MKNRIDFKEIINILIELSSEEKLLIISEEYDKVGFFTSLLKQHLKIEVLDVVTIQILEEFEYKDLFEYPDGKDKFKFLNHISNINNISDYINTTEISKCLIHSTNDFF